MGFQFAMFKPKNLETLRPQFHGLIGNSLLVRYGWSMDKDDPNPGQIAYVIHDPDDVLGIDCHGMWIPEEDLDFSPRAQIEKEGVHK